MSEINECISLESPERKYLSGPDSGQCPKSGKKNAFLSLSRKARV